MKYLFCTLFITLAVWSYAFGVDPDADPCGTIKEEIPKDWIQGTLQVQEEPGNDQGKKINIFYYGKIQKDKTPVVFFNGGPGQKSHDAFYILTKAKRIFDLKDNLSFVFIDQRGTGCSDFYPQGSSAKVLERLSFYGSRGIVEDAESVRKKLIGNKPWIIFGQSYGAHIVHRYVALYPKSVKAAFAHGNALNQSPLERMNHRIGSQVRVMDEYLKLYPDDMESLGILTDQLTLDVCFSWGVKKDKKTCGWEVTEDLMSSFLGSSQNWFKMYQWISLLVDGDKINKDAIQNYIENSMVEPSEKYSKRYADRVIAWTDRNTAPYDKRTCKIAEYELFLKDIEITGNAFTECSSILQDRNSSMDNYGRQMVKFLPQDLLTIVDFKESLKANPQLNFYLYSGERDPFVPKESFVEEVEQMKDIPHFFYKNFPSSGHEGYQTEGQIFKQLAKEAVKS